jgi:uncharacterized protein (DUF1778 family)
MKIGRPKLSDREKKNQITGVRLNGAERAAVEQAAMLSGQSLSNWIRNTLLRKAQKTRVQS